MFHIVDDLRLGSKGLAISPVGHLTRSDRDTRQTPAAPPPSAQEREP